MLVSLFLGACVQDMRACVLRKFPSYALCISREMSMLFSLRVVNQFSFSKPLHSTSGSPSHQFYALFACSPFLISLLIAYFFNQESWQGSLIPGLHDTRDANCIRTCVHRKPTSTSRLLNDSSCHTILH